MKWYFLFIRLLVIISGCSEIGLRPFISLGTCPEEIIPNNITL